MTKTSKMFDHNLDNLSSSLTCCVNCSQPFDSSPETTTNPAPHSSFLSLDFNDFDTDPLSTTTKTRTNNDTTEDGRPEAGSDSTHQISVVQVLESVYKLDYLKSCPDYSSQGQGHWILCMECAQVLTSLYKLLMNFNKIRALDSFLSHELQKLDDCIQKHHHQQQLPQQPCQEKDRQNNIDIFELGLLPPSEIKKEINFELDRALREDENDFDNFDGYDNYEPPTSPANVEDYNSSSNSSPVKIKTKSLSSSASDIVLGPGPWVLLKRIEDERSNFQSQTTINSYRIHPTDNRKSGRNRRIKREIDTKKEESDDEEYLPRSKKQRRLSKTKTNGVNTNKSPRKSRPSKAIKIKKEKSADDDDSHDNDNENENNGEDETESDKKRKRKSTSSSKSVKKVKVKSEKKSKSSSKAKSKSNANTVKKKYKYVPKGRKKMSTAEAKNLAKKRCKRGTSEKLTAIKKRLDFQYKKKKIKYPNPCWYCDEHFDTPALCVAHTKAEHFEENDIICETCGRIFKNNNKQAMIHHRRPCEKLKPGELLTAFPCPHESCTKQFAVIRALRVHVAQCHSDVILTCPHKDDGCNFTTKSTASLGSHVRQQHTEFTEEENANNRCEECNKQFKNSSSLYAHRMYMHTEKGQKKYKEAMKRQLQRGKEKRAVKRMERINNFICPDCNINCFSNFALIYHRKKYHNFQECKYVCDQCGAGFAQRRSFSHHSQFAHTDEKRYVCESCGKGFKNTSNLKDHVKRTHSEEGRLEYNAYMRLHHQRRKFRAQAMQQAKANKSQNPHHTNPNPPPPPSLNSSTLSVNDAKAVDLLSTLGNEAVQNLHLNEQVSVPPPMEQQQQVHQQQQESTNFDFGFPVRLF